MFNSLTKVHTGPWAFFQPWKAAGWELFGYSVKGGDTYEQLEPEAWREALLDAVEWMIWANRGDRMPLINAVCETNFYTRFRDMRRYTPPAKENLLTKRGILRKLHILPFDRTVRACSLLSFRGGAPTHKSEYLGERDDLAE